MNVGNAGVVSIANQRSNHPRTLDRYVRQGQVADGACQRSDHTDVGKARSVDGQPVDAVSQSGKRPAQAGDGSEESIRCVDVVGERVEARSGNGLELGDVMDQRIGLPIHGERCRGAGKRHAGTVQKRITGTRRRKRQRGVGARKRDVPRNADRARTARERKPCRSPGRSDRRRNRQPAAGDEAQRGIGRPADRVLHRQHAAERRGNRDVGGFEVGGQRRVIEVACGALCGRDLEVGGIDQPGAGEARCGKGRDLQVIGHRNTGGGRFNETAIAAIGRRGVERSPGVDSASFHARKQQDLTRAIGKRLRLDGPGVRYDRGDRRARPLRGEQHLAAVGGDQSAILDQCPGRCPVYLHLQMAVGTGVEKHIRPRRQHDVALGCADRTQVGDRSADQHDLPAVMRRDQALVDHRSARGESEPVGTGQEVGIRDRTGRGDDTANVDLRGRGEQHAIGIDDVDLAVRGEIAGNRRPGGGQHAVERNGTGIGLDEGDRGILADVEALPVDDAALTGLGHRHGAAVRCDRNLSGGDSAAGG